jgi:SAM-dependent methyltransferase
VAEYERLGRRPWSRGYEDAKDRLLRDTLADPALLAAFGRGTELPTGYAAGFDERTVEFPWVISQLGPHPERVLDAGSSLNHSLLIEHPHLVAKKLYIVTLAPESNCFWHRGIAYLFEDLRTLPIRDATYDTVVCVSTLEHIGCDNTLYTGQTTGNEGHPLEFGGAVQELRRVLKPGGRLLLTVPFGRYQNFGTFQQFDGRLLAQAMAAFGPATVTRESYYRYTAQGWQVATAASCATAEYVEWITRPPHHWPNPMPVEVDRAAAARAVACVSLVRQD